MIIDNHDKSKNREKKFVLMIDQQIYKNHNDDDHKIELICSIQLYIIITTIMIIIIIDRVHFF